MRWASGLGHLRHVFRHRWRGRRAFFAAAPAFSPRSVLVRTQKSLRFDRKRRVIAERAVSCGRFSGQMVFCWAVRRGARGRSGGPRKIRLVHSRDLPWPFLLISTQCVCHRIFKKVTPMNPRGVLCHFLAGFVLPEGPPGCPGCTHSGCVAPCVAFSHALHGPTHFGLCVCIAEAPGVFLS